MAQAPATPAKNRNPMSDSMLGATAHAMMKTKNKELNEWYTTCRPYSSDNGAQRIGPNA